MDERTRFAKCFVITAENCKSYVLTFVENKTNKLGQTLDQFILNHPDIKNDRMVKQALKKKTSSKELDISVLCVVVRKGKLLETKELKSPGHVSNTAGDLIDRVRQLRNDIAHTSEASLDKDEYEEYLADFLDIAGHFERVNIKKKDTYKREIEKIHKKQWADADVEDQITRYKVYIETVVKLEIQPPTIEENPIRRPQTPRRPHNGDSFTFTKDVASFYADKFDNPIAQAAAGAIGGTSGLVLDGLNFVFNFR